MNHQIKSIYNDLLTWLLPKSTNSGFYQEMIVSDITEEEFPNLYSQNILTNSVSLKKQSSVQLFL